MLAMERAVLLSVNGRVILSVERTAEDYLEALWGPHHGVLREGSSVTVAANLLPSVIAGFRSPTYGS